MVRALLIFPFLSFGHSQLPSAAVLKQGRRRCQSSSPYSLLDIGDDAAASPALFIVAV